MEQLRICSLSMRSNGDVRGGKLCETDCAVHPHVSMVQIVRDSENTEVANSHANCHFTS